MPKGARQRRADAPCASGGVRAAATLLRAAPATGARLVPGDARALAARRRLWAMLELFDAAAQQPGAQQEGQGHTAGGSKAEGSNAESTRAAQPTQ